MIDVDVVRIFLTTTTFHCKENSHRGVLDCLLDCSMVFILQNKNNNFNHLKGKQKGFIAFFTHLTIIYIALITAQVHRVLHNSFKVEINMSEQ